MQTPQWHPDMTDAQYLAYVLACVYLDIKPQPQY